MKKERLLFEVNIDFETSRKLSNLFYTVYGVDEDGKKYVAVYPYTELFEWDDSTKAINEPRREFQNLAEAMNFIAKDVIEKIEEYEKKEVNEE